MRCSGRLLVSFVVVFTLVGTTSGAGAQAGAGAGAVGSAAIAAEPVREAIAARWGVDAADVRIEVVRGDLPESATHVELRGAGADGSWVVEYTNGDVRGSAVIRAGIETNVLVAAHDIARGDVLDAGDIATRRDVRWGPPSSNETGIEAGWVARRRITAGDVLDEAAVEPPVAVRPGQDVKIVWQSGTVAIALSGRAAGKAALGGRVFVRAETGRRMEGTVIADGVVRVGPEGRSP